MGTLPLMPPGYRFAPTDEELMIFYLRNKVLFKPTPAAAVGEIDSDDLYSKPPYAIVDNPCGERREWYFFIRHDKHQHEHNKENILKAEYLTCLGQQQGIGKKAAAFQERRGQNANYIDKILENDENLDMIRNGIDKNVRPIECCARDKDAKFRLVEQRTFANWIGNDFKEEEDKTIVEMVKNRISQLEFEKKRENVRIVGNGIGFWKSVGREHVIYCDENVSAFKNYFLYCSGSIRKCKKTHWRMEEYHLVARTDDPQDLKKEEWVLGRITRGRDYCSD